MDTLTQLTQVTVDNAHALLPQWRATLRAEAKSPGTIDTYTYGLNAYLTWCARSGQPPPSRATMTTWMSAMLESGAAPGSAGIRQLGVRRFVAGLIATGHVPVDPFAGHQGTQTDPKARHPTDRRRAARRRDHRRRAPRLPVPAPTRLMRRLRRDVAG